MRITDFTITRFQFRRNRPVGDSQVRFTVNHLAALELHTACGRTGLGFAHGLGRPFPAVQEMTRIFADEFFPALRDGHPAALVNRVRRPRGGNIKAASLPFGEAVGHALWDLAAQAAGLPLWRLLGGTEGSVPAYASGLEYHLGDAAFTDLYSTAHALGFRAHKIKVGHPDAAWDLHRLDLLRKATGGVGAVMVDANEAWSPGEAIRRLTLYARAGHEILWLEDPCLRDDFQGLAEIRAALPGVLVNAGEYLDLSGKRRLLEARGADLLNIHGDIGRAMRAGWLAAEHGVGVTIGNTPLEIGIHLACALPEAGWFEHAFHNAGHLVEEPVRIAEGRAHAPEGAGHGLRLSAAARTVHAVPEPLPEEGLAAVVESAMIRFSQSRSQST